MHGTTRPPTVVDLFAGAGLLSYAFARAGFRIVRAIELDEAAAATYRANVGDHVEVADLRRVTPTGKCDVLVAGPPCQGFSTLGKRNPRDPRNRLSLIVAHWAKVLKPRVVVIENVEAFLDAPVWGLLRRSLEALGYCVTAQRLNALDFGVAQDRRRSFTIASRVGPVSVVPPRRRAPRTVAQALRGLSLRPDGVRSHVAPKPGRLALARMRVIRRGGDKRDIMLRARRLAAPSWWRLGCAVTDVWGRLTWDAPANTLRTALQNASKGRYIHPTQNRRL